MPTQKLNFLYELYQLYQPIKEPTRITMKSSSLIDHMWLLIHQKKKITIWCFAHWN